MSKNEHFCVVPWTHTYVSPQGERRLCCASQEDSTFQNSYIDTNTNSKTDIFNPISLEEHWNSDYMKNIRLKLLNNEEIPQCNVCNNKVLNIHTYRDYFNKSLFPDKRQEIIENTNSDGSTTLRPISYDYRLSNICNFKCRMCGDQLSSSIEKEKRKHEKIDYKKDVWLRSDNYTKIKEFQKNVLERELLEAVDNNILEEIYWVGGEPLLFDTHWDIMRKLQSKDKSKITIRYNTNLSNINYKNKNLYDLLYGFKNVNLCASIDGTKEIGEYIRTGLNWDKWIKNFKQGLFLNELYGEHGVVFDITLTTPGLFGLKDLFDVVSELDINGYIKIVYAFDPTIVMNPYCLPKEILHSTIYDLLNYINPRITRKTKIFKEVLEDMLNRKTFEEKWPSTYKEGLKNGKNRILYLEKIRTQKITFREILSDNAKIWWDLI